MADENRWLKDLWRLSASAGLAAYVLELLCRRLDIADSKWNFSDAQKQNFSAHLKAAPRGKIEIRYSSADGTRSSELAKALNSVLKDLGYDVWGYIGPFISAGDSPLVGIELSIKDEIDRPIMESLSSAFRSIGIDSQCCKRSSQDASYEENTVALLIGIKP